MKLSSIVFICCLSALRAENRRVIFMKTVGEDFSFSFGFNQSESSIKSLCRDSCRRDEVLIAADGDGARSGRHEVKYDEGESRVQLVIRELNVNDTGRYRYSEMGSSKHQDFEIRVRAMCVGGVISEEPKVHSSPEGGDVTVRCSLNAPRRHRKFFSRLTGGEEMLVETLSSRAAGGRFSIEAGGGGFFNVTISGVKRSDSGRYRCGVAGQDAETRCQEFEVAVQGRYILPRVALLIMVVLFLIFLLVLYSWRIKKNHGPEFPPYCIN